MDRVRLPTPRIAVSSVLACRQGGVNRDLRTMSGIKRLEISIVQIAQGPLLIAPRGWRWALRGRAGEAATTHASLEAGWRSPHVVSPPSTIHLHIPDTDRWRSARTNTFPPSRYHRMHNAPQSAAAPDSRCQVCRILRGAVEQIPRGD